MNKKSKYVYLSNDSVKKLIELKKINGLSESVIIDLLIKKQKKLKLI